MHHTGCLRNNNGNICDFPVNNGCTGTYGCGCTSVLPLPSVPLPIVGNNLVAQNQYTIQYSIPSILNSTFNTWLYTGQDVTINGSGDTVMLDFGPDASSGDLTVHGNNDCGTGGSASLHISVLVIGVPENDPVKGMLPTPNPFHESLNLQNNKQETALIILYSLDGRMVFEGKVLPGNNNYDLTYLRSGVYFARILQGNQSFYSRLLKY